MPVYKVTLGYVMIKAKNEERAKFGACNYIAGDLGIECLKAEKQPKYTRECDYTD